MRTFVYVDGFNLFYGCLKRTRHKWLDLDALARMTCKREKVDKLRYFSARVSARPSDPGQPTRQDAYFRALRCLPNVEIHLGHFLSHPVTMACCNADGFPTGRYETVLKTEEKGSDVNLASYLLLDAFEDRYDEAIVVSNDSDLLTPIRLVRSKLGKRVGLLNPHQRTSQALAREVDYIRQIRTGTLLASQFPERMHDGVGGFHKPVEW